MARALATTGLRGSAEEIRGSEISHTGAIENHQPASFLFLAVMRCIQWKQIESIQQKRRLNECARALSHRGPTTVTQIIDSHSRTISKGEPSHVAH